MNRAINTLPDIMAEPALEFSSHLNWVGMEQIALPVSFPLSDKEIHGVTAFVDVFVSLNSEAKGIHMSRLYLKLQSLLANQEVSFNLICGLLEGLLNSQDGQSNNAKVQLQFDLPLSKPALVTDNSGYQSYPVKISQQLVGNQHTTELEITIPYSSTCPCSVSLTKQLISDAIDNKFASDSLSKSELLDWLTNKSTALATPHNQRSYAYIKLTYKAKCWPSIPELIVQLEKAIGTPVQTTVKRADEQAFAALNGDNLMFCEDAARKLNAFLNQLEDVADFSFKVEHQESLHAHNAVAIHHKQPRTLTDKGDKA